MRGVQSSEFKDHCRVLGCRYKGTHLWQDHTCGDCGKRGHGQMECGNNDLINELKLYGINDKLKEELHCRSTSCSRKQYHTTASHLCTICKNKGKEISKCYHIVQECPEQKPKEEEEVYPVLRNLPLKRRHLQTLPSSRWSS